MKDEVNGVYSAMASDSIRVCSVGDSAMNYSRKLRSKPACYRGVPQEVAQSHERGHGRRAGRRGRE